MILYEGVFLLSHLLKSMFDLSVAKVSGHEKFLPHLQFPDPILVIIVMTRKCPGPASSSHSQPASSYHIRFKIKNLQREGCLTIFLFHTSKAEFHLFYIYWKIILNNKQKCLNSITKYCLTICWNHFQFLIWFFSLLESIKVFLIIKITLFVGPGYNSSSDLFSILTMKASWVPVPNNRHRVFWTCWWYYDLNLNCILYVMYNLWVN